MAIDQEIRKAALVVKIKDAVAAAGVSEVVNGLAFWFAFGSVGIVIARYDTSVNRTIGAGATAVGIGESAVKDHSEGNLTIAVHAADIGDRDASLTHATGNGILQGVRTAECVDEVSGGWGKAITGVATVPTAFEVVFPVCLYESDFVVHEVVREARSTFVIVPSLRMPGRSVIHVPNEEPLTRAVIVVSVVLGHFNQQILVLRVHEAKVNFVVRGGKVVGSRMDA